MYTTYICSIYCILYIIVVRSSWFWWTKQVDVFFCICVVFLRMPFVYVGQINCERQKIEKHNLYDPTLNPRLSYVYWR